MTATAPKITARAQWGANPLVTPASPIGMPSKELWLHHSAGEQFGAAGMRMLQQFTLHRQDAHYVDLEYTFVVDHQSCEIFESRGPGKNTAATGGHNDVSHAICVMGNFQTDPVNPNLVETLANLVAYGFEQGWWPLGFTGGHRDASGNSTACPGDHLEQVIPAVNARAVAIHAPTTPKVAPMYDPPLPIVAVLQQTPTTPALAGVGPDGAIYAWGVPYKGGANGKPYFAGKKAARLDFPTAGEKQAGKQYVIVSTDGSRYAYPE